MSTNLVKVSKKWSPHKLLLNFLKQITFFLSLASLVSPQFAKNSSNTFFIYPSQLIKLIHKKETKMISSSTSSSPNNMLNIFLIYAIICITTSYVVVAQNTREAVLEAHNKARAEVGVDPLEWDESLEDYARSYAEKRAEDCKMEHSGGPYGENLAEGSPVDWVTAVKYWVAEKADYDYNSNSCKGAMCGHYTQVVWRDSMLVGCASSKCKSGADYVVCTYDPAGNFVGDKPY